MSHLLKTHHGGWLPQYPDHRDRYYHLEESVLTSARISSRGQIPSAQLPPIWNQLDIGSCTAHGSLRAFLAEAIRQGLSLPMLSRLEQYWNTRSLEGTTDQDAGAMVRDAIKALAQFGCAPEDEWPYDTSKFAVAPPAQVEADSKQHMAFKYQAILVGGPGAPMRTALSRGLAIVYGFPVPETFEDGTWDPASEEPLPLPGPSTQYIGGHCLSGDTRVPLLDGTTPSIRELAERDGDFWLYSATPDGKVVAGRGHSARLTRQDAPVVRVTLDDGASFVCTADHPLMRRDGQFVEAGSVCAGDSLMPLYRRVNNYGYEEARHPKTGRWQLTHRLVASMAGRYPRGTVVHHVDYDKRNNDPNNLAFMSWDDHARLHSIRCDQLRRYAQSDRGRAKSRDLLNRLWADPEWRAQMEARRGEIVRLGGRASGGPRPNLSAATREVLAENGRRNVKAMHTPDAIMRSAIARRRRIATDPEFRVRIMDQQRAATIAAAALPITERQRVARRESAQKLMTRRWGDHKSRRLRIEDSLRQGEAVRDIALREGLTAARIYQIGRELQNNHKVVRVEAIGREDVYDLTVEDHRNFAIDAGVFVHNCVAATGWNFSGKFISTPTTNRRVRPYFTSDNSWDVTWGMAGRFNIDAEFFTPGRQLASDLWVIQAVD